MAQNLQGLCNEVCSANVAKIVSTRTIYSSFSDMRHYTPTACSFAMRTYEILLYKVDNKAQS